MFSRSLAALALLLTMSTALPAATITKFVVTCVDRQETTNDDIYLAAVADGRPVGWGDADQKGTSTGNAFGMKEGAILTLDAKSLSGLTFKDSLQISLKEKDVTADETFGTVTITPNDGMKHLVFKGTDYEYTIDFTVE